MMDWELCGCPERECELVFIPEGETKEQVYKTTAKCSHEAINNFFHDPFRGNVRKIKIIRITFYARTEGKA